MASSKRREKKKTSANEVAITNASGSSASALCPSAIASSKRPWEASSSAYHWPAVA
jgi:hypothetical protein